jgi:hypothetical protein
MSTTLIYVWRKTPFMGKNKFDVPISFVESLPFFPLSCIMLTEEGDLSRNALDFHSRSAWFE